MDSHGDGKGLRNLHFEGEHNTEEMQQYNEKTISLKKYIPFLEKLIGVIDSHSSKVLSNYLTAVKSLQSMITNPKSNRVKWESLLKIETFIKKLYDRRHHQSENSAAQDIVNFLDTLRGHSTDIYHSPSRPRPQQQDHHPLPAETTPHSSWTSTIRERTTISPRAKTTYLTDPHEPTTSYTNQRVFGPNFSRSSASSSSSSTETWRDRYQWEQQQQQQRNNQNDRYNNNMNSPVRHGFNYRSWDSNNRSNSDYEAGSRMSTPEYDQFKTSSRYSSSPNVVRHQLMRSPEPRTRDPRLLYGRVNPASMNIRSAIPPSVYVPSSRRLSDEIETPRSPSPEPDVPVIPPKIIMDSSPNLNVSSTTGSEVLRCDDEGPGVQEEKQVFSCEFCSYIGKKIIPHHVNRHPGKEVPIKLSKIVLDDAVKEFDDEKNEKNKKSDEVEVVENKTTSTTNEVSSAITEDLSWIPERSIFLRPIDCKICGYTTVVKTNLIQHLISHRNPDKNQTTLPIAPLFNCRFCDSSMNNCQEFRDHITTHTGEFQYTCGYCPFRGFSSKSVRTHINCEHVGKTAFVKRERDNARLGQKVYGFVCSFCRFVQLSEENVTAHVRSHLGDVGAKVICINMSKMAAKKEKKEKVDVEGGGGDEGVKKSPEDVKGVEEARQESAVSETGVFRDENEDFSISNMATQAYVDSEGEENKVDEVDQSTIATQKYVDSEGEENKEEEIDQSIIATQKYVDSEDENLLPTQKYVDSDENENIAPTQKYVDSDENEKENQNLLLTQKYIDSDVENDDVDGSSTPRLHIATQSEDSESEHEDEKNPPTSPTTTTSKEVDENDEEEEEEEAETDTDNSDSENNETDDDESDNSSGDGTNSPPHLEPEHDGTLLNEEEDDDDEENSLLSMLSENGGQLPPSIAETISRLQATLKKGVKRSSLPPPVLEPIDSKTTKLRDETSTPTTTITSITTSSGSYAFKCGAKTCGFFSSDENVFLHHLETSHTPREAPCTECGGCFAQWKLLLAHLKSECEANDKLPHFACGFENCDYATNNELFFFAHTRRTHKKEMQLPCCFCRTSFTLVTSLVRHLKEGCRAAKAMKSVTCKVKEVDKKVKDEEDCGKKMVEEIVEEVEEKDEVFVEEEKNLSLKVVYQCPVSTCDHKSLERNVFRSHVVKFHVDAELTCRVCSKKLDDVDDAIGHMETDHGDEEELVKSIKSIKSIKRPADVDEGPRKRIALDVDKDDEKEKESTAILRTINELSTTCLDVDLDENLPLPLENIRQRDPAVESLATKSSTSLSKMLVPDELKHLFKCMAPACNFATSTRDAFVLHLSENSCGSRNLCSYCMQELPGIVALVDHVVKTHGHCTFQCKYCFYRAITDEYVTLHQQKRHESLSTGSLLCERNPDSVDPVNEPVNGEFVIPYRCAIDGCSYEVADPEEFRQHNSKEHSSTSLFPCHHCGVTCLSTERLLVHYKVHGCNNYQCGFCLHGSETDEEILFHLCSIHPNRRGRLIVRSVTNNKLLESAKYQVKSEVIKPTVDLGSLKMEVSRSMIGGTNKRDSSTPIKDVDLKLGHALFQCGYPPCSYSASTAENLREHMVTCSSSCLMTSAKCPHCGRQWRTITLYLEHVVNQHGGRRFVCGRCSFRGPTIEFVQGHMKSQHGVPADQTKSELKDSKADPDIGEYLVQEITVVTPVKSAKTTEGKSERRTMVTRKGTTFGVDDMDRLPMQCIFPREICCAVCGYATKVRSNLIRHLQMHRKQDGDVASDVKVKDDTKSRHSSKSKGKENDVSNNRVEEKVVKSGEDGGGDSTTGNSGIMCPQFVPNTSLYRCAVEGCDYLALDTTMYKCHVTTLHPDVGAFPCPHCGERTPSLDKLLIHFRLHGPRLYKCNKCNYSSYRHHQIETHHNTAHGNRFLPVITVREQVKEEDNIAETKPVSKKEGKFLTLTPDVAGSPMSTPNSTSTKHEPDARHVWCCAICTHPGPTKSIIKNHLQTCHGVRSEFKCGVCSCVSNAFESVRLHFVSRHPDAEVKIMPLIVKVKDYDPNNLFVTAPKESTSTVSSSSSGGNRVSTSGDAPPTSMPVTRRASLTAAAAARSVVVDEGAEMAAKNDGGSSKDAAVAVTDVVGEKNVGKVSVNEGKVKIKEGTKSSTVSESAKNKDSGDGGGNGAAGKVMFVCPVCHEYRTKFRGDMRIHIYRELHYRRVQCLKCNALFVSEKEAKHHSYKTHRGQALSLQKNEIPERENWVKEQLDGQVLAWGSVPRSTSKTSKILNIETTKSQSKNSTLSDLKQTSESIDQSIDSPKNDGVKEDKVKIENVRGDTSPTETSTLPDDSADAKVVASGGEASRQFRYYCTQCSYQCEGTTDLRKHIFRHLKFKPFQCTHCLLRFSEKQQIRNHHNLFHPDAEFVCERQPNMEPERFVDELLHQQRMEWKDKKKSGSPVVKISKTAAQITVAKMAAESVTTVTTESGSVQKVYACRHDGCNFTCDQLKGLKVHLMAHLRQARFHCGYCSVTGSSQYQVRRHCLSIHAGKKVLVLAIKGETSTTTSSTTTSTSQQGAEESGNSTPTSMMTSPQRSATATAATSRGVRLHKCPYCPYSHTLPKMISRHLMRHYVEKPFQCGHCKRTGIEKFDILYHCRKVHPDLEPKVINTPLPTNPEIRPILRRGHGGHSLVSEDNDAWCPQEENKNSNNTNNENNEHIDSLPLEVQVTELGVDKEPSSPNSTATVTTRRIYECNSCSARFNSKDEVRNHLSTTHQDNEPSYRVVVTALKKSTVVVEEATASLLTSQPVLSGSTSQEATRTSLLKCIYCDLASDSLKLLRKHCHESHTGSEVRLRKMAADWEANGETMLRCGYCPFAVSQMALLWDHHRQEHVGKAVKFRIATRKGSLPGVSNVGRKSKNGAGLMGCHVLWCSYCNDPCESIEQMVRHWKMFHGHLELKYKTQTGVEGIISKELTDGALQGETEHAQSSNTTSDDKNGGENSGNGVMVTMYGCAQCKYESDKYDMVRQHLFRHLQRFACPACRKLYPFEYELKKHVEVHHQGLVLESVKNPQYDDQEKEELIRNIRVRHINKSIEDDNTEQKSTKSRRQVAKKSLRGMTVAPPSGKIRLSAKKSTSSRPKSSNLLLKATLEENLPGVQQRQQEIISELTNFSSTTSRQSLDSPPPTKKMKLDDRRVSLSYRDLYFLSNLQPVVEIEQLSDEVK